MILDILQIGDLILRTPTIDIDDISAYSEFFKDLKETLDASGGVGLAAPQVGKSISVFAMRISPTPTRPDLPNLGAFLVINPQIVSHSDDIYMDREGCLSIGGQTPATGLKGKVPRYDRVEVEYLDVSGKKITTKFEGFIARVFQHEYDHLQGVFFVDQMQDMSSLMTHERYTKLKNQT